jgi:hypothetical protein
MQRRKGDQIQIEQIVNRQKNGRIKSNNYTKYKLPKSLNSNAKDCHILFKKNKRAGPNYTISTKSLP